MSGNDRTFSYARSPLNYPTACPALYRTIEIALAATRRSPSPPLKFGKNGIEARDPGKGETMPPETRPNTISLAEDQLPPSRPVAQGGADESMFSLRLVWQFTLYIAGGSPHSMEALDNLNTLCRKHLADRHHIEIVDVLLHPERALADGVMLTPTLIRCLPVPVRIIIGTLADTRAVLQTLGVVATAP